MCLVIDDSYKQTIKVHVPLEISSANSSVDSNYTIPGNSSTTGTLPHIEEITSDSLSSETDISDDESSISE